MQVAGEVKKIHDAREMLELAVKMEIQSVDDYNKWANECAAASDSVSKKLFEALTAEEEVHQDQFDTEMENLQKFGDHYLALQSVERSKSVAIGTPAAEQFILDCTGLFFNCLVFCLVVFPWHDEGIGRYRYHEAYSFSCAQRGNGVLKAAI